MADPTYTLSNAARSDRNEILGYIEDRDGTLRAEHIARLFARNLVSLAFMPNVGRIVKEAEGEPRRHNIKSWAILYEPAPHGIHVLRIYHARRDLKKVFRTYKRPI